MKICRRTSNNGRINVIKYAIIRSLVSTVITIIVANIIGCS
jgi:hypothetical protein